MERLTNRRYGEISCTGREMPCSSFCNNCSQGTGNCEIVKRMVEKLAEYEDLEEQGRLLKLPCKVGDTIYAVGEIVKEYKVISVGYHSDKATNRIKFCIETLPVNGSRVVAAFYDKEFGKNVFLTKSAAEAKLKELR
jgi:hypothetical protein